MIIKLKDYAEHLGAISRGGLPSGISCGWKCLNEFYRVERKYMTIVTGIPGHGKSEFLDAVFVNLARMHGWKFVIYSPENFPTALHAIKLAEKFTGLYYANIERDKKQEAHRWIDEHFTWLYPNDEQSTLPRILEGVKAAKDEYGCDGFILDPWNEIDHQRPASLTETEYISQSLTKVRRFSRENDVHSWIVAHPTKLRKNDDGGYDPPTPYDISGSSNWRNKADFCITAHRHSIQDNKLSVMVTKVKFKHFGKLGEVSLNYDFKSGRFYEFANEEEDFRYGR